MTILNNVFSPTWRCFMTRCTGRQLMGSRTCWGSFSQSRALGAPSSGKLLSSFFFYLFYFFSFYILFFRQVAFFFFLRYFSSFIFDFFRQVAFLFDFEEIEHTTVLGLTLQVIHKRLEIQGLNIGHNFWSLGHSLEKPFPWYSFWRDWPHCEPKHNYVSFLTRCSSVRSTLGWLLFCRTFSKTQNTSCDHGSLRRREKSEDWKELWSQI